MKIHDLVHQVMHTTQSCRFEIKAAKSRHVSHNTFIRTHIEEMCHNQYHDTEKYCDIAKSIGIKGLTQCTSDSMTFNVLQNSVIFLNIKHEYVTFPA